MRKELRRSRAKGAVRTGDEGSPALVGLCRDGRSSMTLFVETLPRKVLLQKQRDAIGDDSDDKRRYRSVSTPIGHFGKQ